MKKKLVLINPVNPHREGLSISRSSRFPPLGLGVVAALTPNTWEIELVDENWDKFTFRNADLMGITAFTSSAPRAYEIAAIYREKGIPVIMGGIHASMCTEEALRFVDTVVVGEAESVWSKVISDAEKGCLSSQYTGKFTDLKGLPKARHDLFNSKYLLGCVETSRGCPMNCEFCSVSVYNGRKSRRRPVNKVLDELDAIHQKIIFFVDGNILGESKASRNYALDLFKKMVDRRMKKWWFCMASLNFGFDEEILHWARKAGCKMVFIGLEAEKIDPLKEVNKRLNLKIGTGSYENAFERIHRAGIAVLGSFIYGMDSDEIDDIRNRTDFMINSSIDALQATFLTPLPGTRLFDSMKKEDRLIFTDFPKDWCRYDFAEAVHSPEKVSPNKLSGTVYESLMRLYTWPLIVRKAIRTLWNTGNPLAMVFSLQSNICYRKIARSLIKKDST